MIEPSELFNGESDWSIYFNQERFNNWEKHIKEWIYSSKKFWPKLIKTLTKINSNSKWLN
jgi:hypothetical protein